MAFCTRANPVELMVNETAASAVSHARDLARFQAEVSPRAYSGKNESKVDCPALYEKLVTQMVATAVTSRVPSGHARRGARLFSPRRLRRGERARRLTRARVVERRGWRRRTAAGRHRHLSPPRHRPSPPRHRPSPPGLDSRTNASTSPVRRRRRPAGDADARAEARAREQRAAQGRSHDERQRARRLAPRHVVRESLGGGGVGEIRLDHGGRAGEAPDATRSPRNAAKDQWRPCCDGLRDASLNPTPRSERTRMGLRPTRSLRRGHAKSAKNMPRGYAEVR